MITGGISRRNDYHYNLNINVKMSMTDGVPTYYINRLTGDEGKDYQNRPINPFELTIRHHDMILIEGNITSLNNVLDKIFKEHGSSHTLHKYNKLECFDFTECVDNWFMKGCPDIPDINYNILVNDKGISLVKIITEGLEIDFISSSYLVNEGYLSVSNIETEEKWILTNESHHFCINKNNKLEFTNGIYSDSLDKSKITIELQDMLDEYLEPILDILEKI
jgi:hypothetical protein